MSTFHYTIAIWLSGIAIGGIVTLLLIDKQLTNERTAMYEKYHKG